MTTPPFLLWGTSLVPYFPSILLHNISLPVTPLQPSTYGVEFRDGPIFPAHIESGFQDTPSISIGQPTIPSMGFSFGWNTTMGLISSRMLGSINAYSGTDFYVGTLVSRGFPFPRGQFPLGGFSQLGDTPMPRGIPYLGCDHAFGGHFSTVSLPMGRSYGSISLNTPLPLDQNQFTNTQFPFLSMLEFPNLSQLKNHPINHNPSWPLAPMKIPADIPKFDGKTR